MPKLKKLPYFFVVFCLICNFSKAQTTKPVTRTFSFDLKSTTLTSAGVYKKNGTLLRTLWGGVKYKAGTNTAKWDGLDDQGKIVSDSDIEIKVLSSNVKYEWEGAYIGNSSAEGSGNSRFRVFDFDGVQNVIVNGDDAFVASGYAEGWPAEFRFKTTNTTKKAWVGQTGITGSNTDFVATDGKKVFWAGFDPLENTETFVFATNINSNAQFKFPKGVNAHMEWDITSEVTYSAISYKNAPNTIITGMAVQSTGNYLFVSRYAQNELQVLDKTTGALVRVITIAGISKLGVDHSDNLWIVQGGSLQKFVVNSNGTLTASDIKITSIPSVGGFDFSPDGKTIAVCDVTNQVVKGFNLANGALNWSLGTPGGYLKSSTVSNDKFYFKDALGEKLTYLTYLPDGSFYVGDNGNLRIQHFAANRAFIKSIMMLSTNYRSQVDKKVPTRLYADYLEFEIDYSKPLAADNGSWKLKRNWRANFTSKYDFDYKIINIVTFPNGRTYARVKINGVTYELIELVNDGVIRYTGIMLGQYGFLNDDGSKMVIDYPNKHIRYDLKGYDAQNNPIWSTTPEYLANLTTFGTNDPLPFNNLYEEPVTESGKIIYFNCRRVDDKNGDEYHLGAVNKGGTEFLWRTARGTQPSYGGEFPKDGAFDNGNGVESDFRAGGSAITYKDHIFWGYHGEFWKQSQTNIWNHVDGNTGLFVGQFGAIKKDFGMVEAPPAVAGNVFGGTIVEVGGNVYLYHNDEGINNGVHRWKISGLNTVEIQTAILKNTDPEDSLKGIDLMVGLPRNGVPLVDGNSGWSRNPKLNILKNIYTDYWDVKTGLQSYDKFKPVDVSVLYRQEKDDMSVERTLENKKALSEWELSGKISFEGNEANQADLKAGSYLEVLDIKGRSIARFYLGKDKDGGLNAMGNDKIIAHYNQGELQIIDKRMLPISISGKNDAITFKYSDFTEQQTTVLADKNADWSKPAKLRMYFFNKPGDNYFRNMSISEMRFAANQLAVASTDQTAPLGCADAGSISWDLWTGQAGNKIANIPVTSPVSSTKNITSFQTPYYFADNYGSRIRGFLCVPQSGNYRFFIASDDDGELWLSTNADPLNKQRIAWVSGWTALNDYTKSASQKSRTIFLNQGEKYYIEALHKEGNGGDHLSVAWEMPDGKVEAPIPGTRLVPFYGTSTTTTIKTAPLPPTVTITSPVNNKQFDTTKVTIETTVTDVESIVDRVEFYSGTTRIGEAYNNPYSITWSNLSDGTYPIIAKIITDDGDIITSLQINITIKLPVPEICPGTGGLNWDYWGGVAGNNLAQIPFNYPVTSNTLTTSFKTPTLFGDYYGSRLKGYVCVAKSGNYTFYLAADDVGALYLSPDVNAIRKQLIAQVWAPTLPEEYTRSASQKSKKIYLLAGQRYYIEAIHKEWTGADHLSVAWQYEDSSIESPIPGNRLLPYVDTRRSARVAALQTSSSKTITNSVFKDPKSLYTLTNLDMRTYPNPFVQSLNIECYIPEESNYSLQLYSIQGILLKTVYTGNLKAGVAKFNINGSNMPAGVYICRLTSGKKIINKQITLVK